MAEEPIDPEEANNAREYSGETKTAEEQSEQRTRNDADNAAAAAAEKTAQANEQAARTKYIEAVGQLFGGTTSGGVSFQAAYDCVNMFSGGVTGIQAIFNDGAVFNISRPDGINYNDLIDKFSGTSKPDANSLKKALNSMDLGERTIFLSEMFGDDFTFQGDSMSTGDQIQVTSNYLLSTLPYVERLFKGKGLENLNNFKVRGVEFTIDSSGVKMGDTQILTPDELKALKENLERSKTAREEYENALQRGNGADIVAKKQAELDLRAKRWENLGKIADVFRFFLELALGFYLLHTLMKAGKDEANHNSGCYLITNQTYLTDPSTKCYSNTFKIDVDANEGTYNCNDPGQCCNNADFNFATAGQPDFNFKRNKGAPSYWYVLQDGNLDCNRGSSGGADNYTLPAYRSKSGLCDLKKHPPSMNQALSAEAKYVLRQANPNFNFDGGLPANFWNTDGSVTYGIRKLSATDGIANLACQIDNMFGNLSKTIVKTILYIGGAIVLLFVIFYFVKFEYDKHDGKVKAKYRK
jgi:hypothetical protein